MSGIKLALIGAGVVATAVVVPSVVRGTASLVYGIAKVVISFIGTLAWNGGKITFHALSLTRDVVTAYPTLILVTLALTTAGLLCVRLGLMPPILKALTKATSKIGAAALFILKAPPYNVLFNLGVIAWTAYQIAHAPQYCAISFVAGMALRFKERDIGTYFLKDASPADQKLAGVSQGTEEEEDKECFYELRNDYDICHHASLISMGGKIIASAITISAIKLLPICPYPASFLAGYQVCSLLHVLPYNLVMDCARLYFKNQLA